MNRTQNRSRNREVRRHGHRTGAEKTATWRAQALRLFSLLFLSGSFVCLFSICVHAASGEAIVTRSFSTLQNLVSAIVSAIGFIITLWGIAEWGISMQSQDGIAQAHAFKRIGGGLVMILAPQILTLFIG